MTNDQTGNCNQEQNTLNELQLDDYARIVYSLNVEDIQTVAQEDFGRLLTESEVRVVEECFPDYIRWRDAIFLAILDKLNLETISDEAESGSVNLRELKTLVE